MVGDSPRASGPNTAWERLPEVARADALEIQPRIQRFEAGRPAQIRRQDRRPECFTFLDGASVATPWLLDTDITEWSLDRPFRQVASADHAAMPWGVDDGLAGRDFGLDHRCQQPPRPLPEHVGQHVAG